MDNEYLEDYKKAKKRKIKYTICITILVVFIASIGFVCFKISYGGHFALREAKNVKLAFQTLSIEYYGEGKSIYSSSRRNGLTKGVNERLAEVVSTEDFTVSIQQYDGNARKVKAFTYETKPYRVTYILDNDDVEHWEVDYFFPLQTYEN